jgi:hypothetical protein
VTREEFGLAPEGQDGRYDEVADELVASVDGEKFHGLLHEKCACELNGGDETKPYMGADRQAIFEIVSVHVMEEQRKDKGGNQAGDEGDKIGWASAFLHFLDASLIVRVVAHFTHPGIGEEQWEYHRKPVGMVAMAATRKWRAG